MALGRPVGGWRVVHTMGSKITRLNPRQAFVPKPPLPRRYSVPYGSAFLSHLD